MTTNRVAGNLAANFTDRHSLQIGCKSLTPLCNEFALNAEVRFFFPGLACRG
jgi:hypothetical protein